MIGVSVVEATLDRLWTAGLPPLDAAKLMAIIRLRYLISEPRYPSALDIKIIQTSNKINHKEGGFL